MLEEKEDVNIGNLKSKIFSCCIINESSLGLVCAKNLLQRGHRIYGIISDHQDTLNWANENGIKVLASIDELHDISCIKQFDYLFSIVNSKILSKEILNLPKYFAVNYHDSPLPRYAGVHSTCWAILNEEKFHGITWHKITKNVDAGDILKQVTFPIYGDDTALSLNLRCYEQAIKEFSNLLDDIETNKINKIPQNISERSFFGLHKKPLGGGVIDWNASMDYIGRLVRATHFGNYENNFTRVKVILSKNLIIYPNKISFLKQKRTDIKFSPGKILSLNRHELVVSCKDGLVRLQEFLITRDQILTLEEIIYISGIKIGRILPLFNNQQLRYFTDFMQDASKNIIYWQSKLKISTRINLPWAQHLIGDLPLTTTIKLSKRRSKAEIVAYILIFLNKLTQDKAISFYYIDKDTQKVITKSQGLACAEIYNIHFNTRQSIQSIALSILNQIHYSKRNKKLFSVELEYCLQEKINVEIRTQVLNKKQQSTIFTSNINTDISFVIAEDGKSLDCITAGNQKASTLLSKLQKYFSILESAHLEGELLGNITLNTKDELRTIAAWNDTEKEFPYDKTIHQLFEEQAERTPDSIAVVYEDSRLTYQELNERANRLAYYLVTNYNIRPDTLVPLLLDRSENMLIGILAVLKSGGAYVPMDSGYPDERIGYILKDTNARVVIANGVYKERLEGIVRGIVSNVEKIEEGDCDIDISINVVPVDSRELQEDLYQLANIDAKIISSITSSSASNLAYVIYTSGTTGNPKGVLVEHRGVVNLKYDLITQYYLSIKDNEVMLQLSNYVFDASIEQIMLSLLNGYVLVLVPDQLWLDKEQFYSYLNKTKVSHIDATPTFVESYDLDKILHLKRVVLGGEPLKKNCYNKLALYGDKKIINAYGITEASINSTNIIIKGNYISIGSPNSNTKAYILDNSLGLLPVGGIGELHIGGVGVARGYLNRAELTAERFIANPFQSEEEKSDTRYGPLGRNARLYKTGDLVRWLPDGNLEYIGRSDFQVKIRGFRIEPGEIESILSSYTSIKQCVVIAREHSVDGNSSKYLVAYYTSVSGEKFDDEELRTYLSSKLPDYMIPSAFVFLDSLPLTINGKLDRRALPDPEFSGDSSSYVAPRNEVEAKLCSIFASVLGIDSSCVGITDDFFRLGGNSISAIRLISKIKQDTSIPLSVAAIFTHKNVKALASYMEGSSREDIIISKYELLTHEEKLLSFAQERLWFIEKYESGTYAYNIPMVYELNTNVKINVLKQAITGILERHEVLRSLIKEDKQGNGYQHVIDFTEQPFTITETKLLDNKEVNSYLSKDATNVFDLASEYPIKVSIYHTPTTSVLSIVIHHIAFDGWSTEIFLNELKEYYRYYSTVGGVPLNKLNLPTLSIQYKDFALWQRSYLRGRVLEEQLSYWKGKLEGYETLNLITDYPRPVEIDYKGKSIYFELDKDLSSSLREVSKKLGVSLYTLLLSAYYLMLRAYSNQNDIVIGTPVANRHYLQIEHLIGFFVNTLALRIQMDTTNDATLEEFIKEIGSEVISAQIHQDLPFEKLVDELSVPKDRSRHPIFQVMFGVQGFGNESGSTPKSLEESIVSPYYWQDEDNASDNYYNVAKFDLETFIDDSDINGLLRGVFNYRVSLYKEGSIKGFIDTYVTILQQVSGLVEEAEIKLQDLSYLSREDRELVLSRWNDTEKEFPYDKTIHQLFEEQAERTPDSIAVVYEDSRLTYQELNERANRLAYYLVTNYNITKGTYIALALDHSIDLVVSFLAVLKVGCVYVPLDLNYPKERLDYILQDTAAPILITLDKSNFNDKNIIKVNPQELLYHKVNESVKFSINHNILTNHQDILYIIYTSGTTGKPKGICNINIGITNRMLWTLKHYQVTMKDSLLQLAAIGFDISVWEILFPLLSGGRLVIPNSQNIKDTEYLANTIKKENISVIHCVPSLLDAILDNVNHKKLKSIKQVVCGGEAISKKLHSKFISSLNIPMYHAYGPTETAISVTHWQSNEPCTGEPPIGIPISNSTVYVLSVSNSSDIISSYDTLSNAEVTQSTTSFPSSLTLLPIGGIGELYVGGVGVARGYLNRAELTAERFIANPFQSEEEKSDTRYGPLGRNARLYKTGDLVRWLPDGNLEYIGRSDFQVKIRGFRIEPGEIESILSSYTSIKQCVVIAREHSVDGNSSKYLVAYYTSVSGEKFDDEELRTYLSSKLPDYMIPSAFVFLDSLPLTINGKLDRRALPDPEFSGDSSSYVAPRNEVEAKLCSIFASVLGIDSSCVGITDDFFRLGGDSIVSIQLVSRIRQNLTISNNSDTILCSVKDIFTHRTIQRLYDNVIKHVIENKAEYSTNTILAEQGILSGEVALLPIQEWFFKNDLAEPDHWNQSFLVKVESLLDISRLQHAVKALINQHDAFRLRYRVKSNKQQDVNRLDNNDEIDTLECSLQYYDDASAIKDSSNEDYDLKILDVSTLSSQEELNDVLTSWQSNFNLQRGPLHAVGYLYGYEDGSSRIFFALHHLIVDAVSWRILTEDLKSLYYSIEENEDSNKLLVTQKGTSYRQWAEIVESYAATHEEERSYWDNVIVDIEESNNKLEQVRASSISSEFASVSISSSILSYAYSSFSLDKEVTSKLLKESNRAYNTEVNDLLLSALSLSLNQIIGSNVNHITLEGHGREEGISNKPLDISRTVGWFTTMYPVRLEVVRDQTGDIEIAETIASTIKYTKELLRGIPNKGIGFGSIIGYKEELLPKISFNYLGQLDQAKNSKSKQSIDKLSIDIDSSQWNITDESSGISIGESNEDKNIININGSVVNGILSFSIVTKLSNELTQKIAEVLKEELISIINYTFSLARSYLTVSDIAVNKIISQTYLDRIQEDKEIDGVYLANSLQQGFIYHYLNQGDIDDAYIVQSIWQYKNRLDLAKLKAAWELAQAKYPTLRLRFSWEEELVQVIDSVGQLRLDWRYIDISQDEGLYDISKQEEKIKEIQERDRKERYSLGKGNLFRVYIIKQGEDLYSCILSEHHAIMDGWSSPILLQFVHETYKSLCKGVGKAKINNSVDQAYLDAQVYIQRTQEEHEEYWHSYIDTIEERVDLGILVSKAKIEGRYQLSNHKQVLDPQEEDLIIKGDIYSKLKALSQREGITLNAILQYVWHKVLKLYGSNNSGEVFTIVGTTVSGRNIAIDGIEESVGLYINTLPLIVRHDEGIDDRSGIIEAIKRVQSDITELNSRSNTNLSRIQKEGRRLFDTLFVFENYPIPVNSEESKEVSLVNIEFKQAIEKLDYPLSVIAYEIENGLSFTINYARELFEVDTIRRLLSTVDVILEQVSGLVEEAEIKLQDLGYLSREDRELVLSRWNDTEKEFPYDKTIHQLFEEQVERTPDSIAVVYEDSRLTYQELNERANRLAYYLVTNYNIRPDTLVPLLLDRSENMLIGILAVLKSGGAYVPMDSGYPDERIGYILKDTNARVVIANGVYKERLEGIVRGIVSNVEKIEEGDCDIDISINVVPVDSRELQEELYQLANIDAKIISSITSSSASNLAYVIYTSGTTGNPKGVLIEHRGVVNRIKWMDTNYPVKTFDRILQKTPYIFDVSVWELFWANWYGASIVFSKSEGHKDTNYLIELINKESITITHFVPSMFSVLEDSVEVNKTELPSLRYIFCSGEVLTLSQVKKCHNLLPNTEIHNLYGPTEVSIDVLYYNCSHKEIEQVYIGTPISNTKAYIISASLTLVPIGGIGELYIGGVGVARGYLNRAELTAERFIANPFQSEEEKSDTRYGPLGRNARLYKTGDLVRWLPDGNLEYIGRSDFQVKIRGFRIEPGEIESILSSYTSIKQCVVIAREHSVDGNSSKYLVAYYTSVSGEKFDDEELRTYLSSKLPDYMIPSAFVFLDSLPLTINGKLDRRALPDPEFSGDSSSYVAPRNEVEAKLCSIFASVLGIDSSCVGITDDFFRLGGNSISAIRLISKIKQDTSIPLSVAAIFTHKNVKALASYMESSSEEDIFVNNVKSLLTRIVQTKDSYQTIIKLNNSYKKKNMFMIHPGVGGCEVYTSLAAALSNNFSCYGIDSYNLYNESKIVNLHELAKYYLSYIDEVMKKTKQKDYHFLGWSLGGQISLEIASILEQKVNTKIKIYLLDTILYDDYLLSLANNLDIEELEDKYEEYATSLGYEKSYIAKVISNMNVESNLIKQKISSILTNTQILLFKANLEDPSEVFKTDNSKKIFEYLSMLKYNNVDNIIGNKHNIELIEINNAHHRNIIDQEEILVSKISSQL